MLKNWAMRSANAAAIRSAGDAEYARKRAEKERSEKKAAERRRARVQAARTATLIVGSEQQTILRHAHQYGAAVSKMNRAKLGKPNRMRKINRFPNPVPVSKRGGAKKKMMKRAKGHHRAGGSRSDGQLSIKQGQTGTVVSAGSSVEQEIRRLENAKQRKRAQQLEANNGWGMMSKYAAARLDAEKKAERDQRRLARTEMKAYLDKQVMKKQKYFTDLAAEKKYWLKKNNEDQQKWREDEKREKEKILLKNLEIKRAREAQLAELESRRRREELILKQEDDRMMERQRKEKARLAREKRARIIEQQAALDRVKEENLVTLAKKEAAKKKQWEEDARLDAQWKEILDKQEKDRADRLEELYRKQQGLVKIGQIAAETNANNDAEIEARIKRHQDELAAKEDAKAAARAARAKKMKVDMLKSINEAIQLKEQIRKKQAVDDLKFAQRFISESNQALNDADEEKHRAKR
eukprot:g2566.t1